MTTEQQGLLSVLKNLWFEFDIQKHQHSLKRINSLLPKQEWTRTYKLLLQVNRNLETSFKCIGPSSNQSCLYKNLYYSDGTFWILSAKKITFPLPDVSLGAFILPNFNPNWRRFYAYDDLEDFVKYRANPIVIPNITLYFHQPWLTRIGHALFDGLYPAYVALIRFQPKHSQPFRILLDTFDSGSNLSLGEDVYNKFSGLGIINITILQEMSAKRWFVFQEIVMGSGHLCQRCIQPNLQLPGGIELNGSRLFRHRMYKQYGLPSPVARQIHSAERRDINRPLKAYVINNKRFSPRDSTEIIAAINEINEYTNALMNQSSKYRANSSWPLVHAAYIDYSLIVVLDNGSLLFNATEKQSIIEASSRKMVSHLRLLQDTDIYVTGPGTGQMYQTFLPDGSVIINLGGVRFKKQKHGSETYTSFMEQYITAGTPYIKGLYYPIKDRPAGIKKQMVTKLIREAAQLIINGFMIPVDPKDNLALDGQLFIEMCALDKEFCMAVTERSEKLSFSCIDTWPEDVVHENGPWSPDGVVDGDRNVTCPYNRTLLYQLREKYSFD